ncbi:MAG TPA: MerR family transcriptional regulator [Candidatus Limnocylindria bacterium]|nr:MerR family transcriptional regulator [Candidatus Limnocylindria bacterium]
MKLKRKRGFYSISAVSEMFSVHQQTIRLYEKEGLICPKRSDGNTRLFSEEDVDHLEEIVYLTHQLGINIAGVQMILKLKKQINKMQKDMNKVFDQTQAELDKETEQSKAAVKTSVRQLMALKKERSAPRPSSAEPLLNISERTPEPQAESDNWDIDYDD